MNKIYRYLLIAICAIGILFGLQYLIPAAATALNIPGIPGLPNVPAMPTYPYNTVEPLPLLTSETPAPAMVVDFATATPLPGATEASTGSPTAITLTPTPTTTPIFTPTITQILQPTATTRSSSVQISATPRPFVTKTTSAEPCYNILYPIQPGRQWTYQVNANSKSAQANMVVVAVNGQQGSIRVTNPASGITATVPVQCDNGVILSFPWVAGGLFLNSATGGSGNVQYVGGVLAPDEAAFRKTNWGLSWGAHFLVTGDASASLGGNTYKLKLSNAPLDLSCQTTATGSAAFERISVQAGTSSQALKVICTAQVPATVSINGQVVSATLTGHTTQWFAPYIGLLKMQVDSATASVLGISVPVNVSGQVELTHYSTP